MALLDDQLPERGRRVRSASREPVEFGVLVPQDRTSMRVRMELVGREKVKIGGTERELLRLNLMGEAFSWALWVDDKDSSSSCGC